MITIPMKISVTGAVPMTVTAAEGIRMTIGAAYEVGGEPYRGEYEFTPGDEGQIIQTEGKILLQNVTINPIPSNYGKIGWNGSVLTVS